MLFGNAGRELFYFAILFVTINLNINYLRTQPEFKDLRCQNVYKQLIYRKLFPSSAVNIKETANLLRCNRRKYLSVSYNNIFSIVLLPI